MGGAGVPLSPDVPVAHSERRAETVTDAVPVPLTVLHGDAVPHAEAERVPRAEGEEEGVLV